MAIRDIFKLSRKTFFNPSGWLGLGSLKANHSAIASSFSQLFKKPTAAYQENFDEAMERLKLTDKDIADRMTVYKRYALIFVLIGFAIFFYAFHFLFMGKILSWLLGIAASGISFSQAFKYHFWSFQLRQRRLGASFSEWKKDLLS